MEYFEVSNATAAAMHRWRAQSGEPFTCEACAGTLDEIQGETDASTDSNRQCGNNQTV